MARITRRDLETEFDAATGQLHKFTLKEFVGHVLEVDSVHFHYNSAVLLPNNEPPEPGDDVPPSTGDPDAGGEEAAADGEDEGPSDTDLAVPGLAILRAAYVHAKANPSQKVLITGHTDTSGGKAGNVTLSHKRAESVKHALLGNKDEWVAIAKDQHRVECYQQILTWVANVWVADCDPDGVDNIHGAKTTLAVQNFQTLYNEEFEAEISVDGVVGKQTWEAIFDIYMEILADIMDVDVADLAAERARITFLDDSKAGVGCGEHFPVDLPGVDGRRSASNRRVQVLFFDPGEEPLLDECHPKADECKPDECEIYKKRFHFFWPIDPDPVPLLPRYKLEVELGDIDKLMTPIIAETHTDPGVRERLQSVGFLYLPLNHASIAERAEEAWKHFKAVYTKNDDASAVAHLRDRVEQLIVDTKALPPKGELKKLRVPGAYCVTPEQYRANFWGTNGGGHRYTEECNVWRNNDSIGRIPVLAKVQAKFRRGWRPAGGLSLHFQFDKPDDIPAGHAVAREALRTTTTTSTNKNSAPPPANLTFNMTGSPHKYVDDNVKLKPPGVALADNVHKDFGGKRGQTIRGVDPVENLFEVGMGRAHFHDELHLHTGRVSTHPEAVKVDTNDAGHAVAVFMPSFMGGDRFKFRVFIDPLRGSPSNGRAKPAVVTETGTLVVWRIFRISKYLRWRYPVGTTPQQKARCFGNLDNFDMPAIKKEYKKAWLDVELESEARAPTNISAAQHTAAIQYAKSVPVLGMSQLYDLSALILETGTSAGVIELRTKAQYDAAPKAAPAPAGGWPTAAGDANYWPNMARVFHSMKTEFLHYFTKNAISGLTILQAPAVTNFSPDKPAGRPPDNYATSGWGTDRRGCWVLFGHAAYFGGMPYDHTANALHETGHLVYGVHQYTKSEQANVSTGGGFDGHDYKDLCIMGYMKCDHDFCGRCVLSQAGLDTSKLAANNPGP